MPCVRSRQACWPAAGEQRGPRWKNLRARLRSGAESITPPRTGLPGVWSPPGGLTAPLRPASWAMGGYGAVKLTARLTPWLVVVQLGQLAGQAGAAVVRGARSIGEEVLGENLAAMEPRHAATSNKA